LQPLGRRPSRQRVSGGARQYSQVEQVLSHPGGSAVAACGIDEQCRKVRQMFRASLDGIDPAPFAFIEVGCRQKGADRQYPGQRRADLMRECGERRFDHAGLGLRGNALASRLRRRIRGAFLRRLLFFGQPPATP